MSSIETKSKIINSAIMLFNQHGLANVRLQMIADESGISIGNLVYHFKNKEAIVESSILSLQEEFSAILSTFRQRNDFLDFDLQLDKFYFFIKSNPYFFFDAIDIKRNFPQVPLFKKGCPSKLLYQIENRFNYNVQKGLLNKEVVKGFYEELAHSIWGYIAFFVPQNFILKQSTPSLVAFKKHIWMQFIPHLTEKGKEEFSFLLSPILQIELS